MQRQKYWIGFDLGGTKMLAAVLDRDFKIVAERRRKSRGSSGRKSGLARVIETIDQVLAEAGITRRQVAGIGIGVPGMLDLNRGVLLQAPNLGWRNVPLRKELGDTFRVPVVVANDVDAGTYGEYRCGAGRKGRCVVGIFPGTGIGGACIYEGRILRGKVGSCMEIGHILVRPNGPLCGCGRRGCLETVASRLAIAAEAAQAAYRGQAPHLMAIAGTDLANIRSGALAESIEAGDKAIEHIVRAAAHHLGQAIVNCVHLMAPDLIVLGGGLVEEMERLYLNEVRDTVQKGVTAAFRDTYRIEAATLGDNAVVVGAAALAAENGAPIAAGVAGR